MLRLKNLKAGDLIRVDDSLSGAWVVVNIQQFKTILGCLKDDPKRIPEGSLITYLGEIKIPNQKTGKMFYGCYYNEQIIYISQYFMQSFTKIKKGTR